jgi:hypothetical protein
MPTMHLGVTDIPYSWGQRKAGGISAAKALQAAKRGGGTGTGVTTGDVAGYLEARYGVMVAYLQMKERDINATIENSVLGALESSAMGKRVGVGQALDSATQVMQEQFKDMLSLRELDGKIRGVPTLAAMRGVSHRFKRPYVRRPERPSFIDTGLYQASFRVWTT